MKILTALFIMTALLLAGQESGRNPVAGDPAAITAGARLYEQTCQGCHGGGGKGGRARSLNREAFQHGGEDREIFKTIRDGIAGTEMPPFSSFTDEQTWQLVSYIRSLSADPAAQAAERSGDPSAGQEIFFGKGTCSTCHEVNGRGGIVGPELSSVGKKSEKKLREKILNPNDRITALMVTVRTRDGGEIRGVQLGGDGFSLQVVDVSGRLHLLERQALAAVQADQKSLMPDDFSKRLSASEVRDLVSYLKTLNGRDLKQTMLADIDGGLTFERIRNSRAEPENWLTYWGDYQGSHYSALNQINESNVRHLQVSWAKQVLGDSTLEATPLVVDGVMYLTGPTAGEVLALDACNGQQIWKYSRTPKVVNKFANDRDNRGVAVLGNRVFFGTLDAALVALDARTGRPLWEAQVADALEGYVITSAPLAIKDKIITGIAGGDSGIRGFVDAYDARTGRRLWRFHTIPGPGEFGHDTWKRDSWMRGSGATWLTGTYDPDLDIVYWPVGNPGPDLDASVRPGDNLFTCSVVALNPETGERKWHYQFTPGDTHDWDSTQDLVLVDRVYRGEQRKLLLHADRNGMFYALDRTTGKFLSGTPFVRQTWNTGFDENGRPKVVAGWKSSPDGSIPIFPGESATNWQSPSYSPRNGWLYLTYVDYGQQFFSQTSAYEVGKLYWGGWSTNVDDTTSAGIKAIDAETGKVMWDYTVRKGGSGNGVLATGGGLVFAATFDGNLIALDDKTGRFLWRFQTGARMRAAPISYAVDGRQYVAISAGNVLYSFALPAVGVEPGISSAPLSEGVGR